MQAVKAHEARIIDALQRNCVKAFIVIIDGQTPKKKPKNLLMFSHPSFIFPHLKILCGTTSRKKVHESATGLAEITGFLSVLRHR